MAACLVCRVEGRPSCDHRRETSPPGLGTQRCDCCRDVKPVWLEHGGNRYCGYACADAWGEELRSRGVSLLVAARTQQAREHLAEAGAAIARGRAA